MDIRRQFLINEIVNVAPSTTSQYPMQALKARKRLGELMDELKANIEELESRATPIPKEKKDSSGKSS